MNTFNVLIQICGLSHREAAGYLDVRPDTVKSWSAGRNGAPEGVLESLADLDRQIASAAERAVEQVVAQIESAGARPAVVTLGVAADDHEARNLGWPGVGAHRAVIGRAAATLIRGGLAVEVVPRGADTATAAAATGHDPGAG